MEDVREQLAMLMRHLCRMRTMDSFSFYWYGKSIRRWNEVIGGKAVRWFNVNALED